MRLVPQKFMDLPNLRAWYLGQRMPEKYRRPHSHERVHEARLGGSAWRTGDGATRYFLQNGRSGSGPRLEPHSLPNITGWSFSAMAATAWATSTYGWSRATLKLPSAWRCVTSNVRAATDTGGRGLLGWRTVRRFSHWCNPWMHFTWTLAERIDDDPVPPICPAL